MNDESIFAAALAIISPAERAAYLDQACRGNPALRQEVEELLAAHAENNPLDRTLPLVAPTEMPQETAGTVIAGKYKLLERIGEGGMGSVWMADQLQPVKRRVAVKLIKTGMDSKSVLARFEAERQALAMMDHPNIAKILDGGITGEPGGVSPGVLSSGTPYFVMELVKGTPITKFCDARKLSIQERLELFVPVCQAIQHAHMKGIIHRDIKPSNVLVALYDDKPVPKVIDFGIAKAAGQPLTDRTLATGFGAIVGTPEYMSPEQASFNQLDVDTRSDVYSLGVLLYELLTGAPPIDRAAFGQGAILKILEMVREVEPPRPSTKFSTKTAPASIAALRGLEPSRLAKLLRGELDWVVMKALEKDRTRRYESANGLGSDVQRYLAGEAVQAVPPSSIYRFKKFLWKNRGPAIAGSAIAAALLVGIAAFAWQSHLAQRERDVAQSERDTANQERKRADAEMHAAIAANAELLANADERQFAMSFPRIAAHSEQAIPPLMAILETQIASDSKDDEKEILAKQQANAAVALLRMNQPEKVWPLLKHQPDPRLRSYLIHRLALLGADPKAIIVRIDVESEVSIRRALILTLGEFDEIQLPLNDRHALLPKMQETYRHNSDPGLHAAVEWLLQSWKEDAWLSHINAAWAKEANWRETSTSQAALSSRGSRQWYVNGEGQTMIVFRGPVVFMMGSPKGEAGQSYDERQHLRKIGRTFAVAAKHVTVEQYTAFDPKYKPGWRNSNTPKQPVVDVSWHQAAAYCNWLSDREEMPKDQWCYEFNDKGEVVRMKPNYLSLAGYRMPTEAEIEYATRAETCTGYYFGATTSLLPKYAWCIINSNDQTWPVGLLKPNDYGLFDVHGNVWIWSQNWYRPKYPETGDGSASNDSEDNLIIANTDRIAVRGGSFFTPAYFARSARREGSFNPLSHGFALGIRVARTITH